MKPGPSFRGKPETPVVTSPDLRRAIRGVSSLIDSGVVRPGMKIGVATAHPAKVVRPLMDLGCFVSVCRQGVALPQDMIQERVEQLWQAGVMLDLALIADVPPGAGLAAMIREFAPAIRKGGYLAVNCVSSADEEMDASDQVTGELMGGHIGGASAELFASLGLEPLDRRLSSTKTGGWLFVLKAMIGHQAREDVFPIGMALERNLLVDTDPLYSATYMAAMHRTGTPDAGTKRRDRFYNLIQLLEHTEPVPGKVIECGTWRGLSARLMCLSKQARNPRYRGEDLVLCDSFEGLGRPTDKDVVVETVIQKGRHVSGRAFKKAGSYAANIDHVREALDEFPEIHFHKGWIPESLATLPTANYRFAHIDLDLYEPIIGALKYLWPIMSPGGIVLCDDYGSLVWPGAKQAVDEFCRESRVTPVRLSAGQAFIIKQ